MNTREKLIKARLGMLALAEELQSIRLACQRAGISRRNAPKAKIFPADLFNMTLPPPVFGILTPLPARVPQQNELVAGNLFPGIR